MRIPLYAQNRHIVIWNGVPISGFADGDFISVKLDGNSAQRTHGGDGPAMSLSTAQGGQITLSLMPTSPALGILYADRESQSKSPSLFTIQLVSGVEEVIHASGCAYGDLPQLSTGGPQMAHRQFVAECLKIALDGSAVEAVAGALL